MAESALQRVFRTATDATVLNAPVAALDDDAFNAMLARLQGYRILRHSAGTDDEGGTPRSPTLEELAPLMEAVHHACRTGAYDDEAYRIYYKRISQGNRYYMGHVLGAFDTILSLMQAFFPGGD